MRPIWILLLLTLPLAGCFGPNYAQVANDLRDRNLRLEQQLAKCQQEQKDRAATITQLQEQLDAKSPRVPTLPETRLAELFTVARIELRSTSDAWDFNNDGRQDGFRVYVRPLMDNGDALPATGTLTVEAFDLALEQGSQRLGAWTFTPADLKTKWYGTLGLNQFAVNCPWKQPPQHREITFKARFIDALTGRVYTDQKLISVHLTAASPAAATAPASAP